MSDRRTLDRADGRKGNSTSARRARGFRLMRCGRSPEAPESARHSERFKPPPGIGSGAVRNPPPPDRMSTVTRLAGLKTTGDRPAASSATHRVRDAGVTARSKKTGIVPAFHVEAFHLTSVVSPVRYRNANRYTSWEKDRSRELAKRPRRHRSQDLRTSNTFGENPSNDFR